MPEAIVMKSSGTFIKQTLITVVIAVVGVFASYKIFNPGGDSSWFSHHDKTIIVQSDSVMYVAVYPEDSVVLRTPSVDFTANELGDPLLGVLKAKMFTTLTDPSQDGVGIAGPQVGINKRIIWVKRYDKEGGPLECYLNIRVDSLYGAIGRGPEGCLSLPPKRGIVPRYETVDISYIDSETLQPCKETVNGYTAIIFQHECDHLEGILYIDKADTVFVSESWEQERKSYSYKKPDWWN